MKYITSVDNITIDSAPTSDVSQFERGSYRSTKRMIEEFMIAGKRLEASRAEMYDDISDEEDFQVPPIRQKNFDLADASAILNKVADKAKEAESYPHEETSGGISEPTASEPIVGNSEASQLAEEALKN